MLAGQYVTCLTRKYSQLVFGNLYLIERVTWKGSLKFTGHRHLYDRKNFALAVAGVNPAPVPVPKPAPKPVVVLTLAEELTKKAGNNAGTCSYAFEFEGGHRRFQINDACHARMRWGSNMSHGDVNTKKPIAVACNISGHVPRIPQDRREAYKLWVAYMLNDSPWASAWLTKDVDEAMKGSASMDVTKPFSYVCAAAIALRSGSEFHHFLPVFQQLIEMKYNPHVAYTLSQMTRVKDGTYTIVNQGGSHHVIHSNMDMAEYVQFFNTGLPRKPDAPFNESPNKYYLIFLSIAQDLKAHNVRREEGQLTVLETIANDNKELVKDVKHDWVTIKAPIAKDFNEYLKIVNTFARKFK